jgi:hypothetical protein
MRSTTNTRRWVYCLPYHTTVEDNTTKENCLTIKDTPPPSYFSSRVESNAETTTGKEIEVSQQLFNINSTTIQQPENVEGEEKAQTLDEVKNTETQEFIQHITKDEGERGCVEQSQSSSVLQTEQVSNSSTTQKDTPSQSNSQDFTWGQEVFQQKYQPVEVLNSEGEWISGYFVHKCLEVANLEGIERKYALFDESGAVYAFWGEIRVPRRN